MPAVLPDLSTYTDSELSSLLLKVREEMNRPLKHTFTFNYKAKGYSTQPKDYTLKGYRWLEMRDNVLCGSTKDRSEDAYGGTICTVGVYEPWTITVESSRS